MICLLIHIEYHWMVWTCKENHVSIILLSSMTWGANGFFAERVWVRVRVRMRDGYTYRTHSGTRTHLPYVWLCMYKFMEWCGMIVSQVRPFQYRKRHLRITDVVADICWLRPSHKLAQRRKQRRSKSSSSCTSGSTKLPRRFWVGKGQMSQAIQHTEIIQNLQSDAI